MKKKTLQEVLNTLHEKYRINLENGCHEWTSGKSNGYGIQSVSGQMILAHRLSYIKNKGYIPVGMFVLHKCDNPVCINPEHLFLGTHLANIKDKVNKDRSGFKLTIDKVKEIKELLKQGLFQKEIAKQFGIDRTMVSQIKTGKRWSHVNFDRKVG